MVLNRMLINKRKDKNDMIDGILGGLLVGAAATLVLLAFLDMMDPFGKWIKSAIIAGIILTGLCTYFLGSLGFECDIIKKTVKDTIMANYDDVTNYHNINNNQSFVADGSRYSFDYDKDTKTLTVFTDTKSSVDAVFVDGVKQAVQNVSDDIDQKKACTSYQINTEDNSVDESSFTTSSVAELPQKIQDKIQSRYNGAVLTSFDTVDLSGTFTCGAFRYSFSWESDMLEIINVNDNDDVVYYKIVEK